jgi:leucyl aminopeptidase
MAGLDVVTETPLTLLIEPTGEAKALIAVAADELEAWIATQPARIATWLKSSAFKADAGKFAMVPSKDGTIDFVVFGLGSADDLWVAGDLARSLPANTYRLAGCLGAPSDFPTWIALAWALGGYRFDRYKSSEKPECAKLEWPDKCDRTYVQNAVVGIVLARDLVNTPAADMLPDALEKSVRDLAARHGASLSVTTGEDLIANNFPMIHAVGRASAAPPRLIDLRWGDPSAPKVTLVGKGVCFDTGGLDLKPSNNMILMKKDMGGAATVLGLASMVMAAQLPIRLRVLIPAVENAVSGNAFRPGDVLKTRNGLSVEIGNTDAEGRLVLGDALTEAIAENPSLLVDCATLTGSARAALGPELPAMFTNDETLACDAIAASEASRDPLWRLPLWQPYRKTMDSKVADINNTGSSPFAGAITAALFLKEFVGTAPWIHIDLYAWNPTDRPGRPAGGEAMALRALYALIEKRFSPVK